MNFYKGNYTALLILPGVLFLLFGYLAFHVSLGLDLTGGTSVSIRLNKDVDVSHLANALEQKFGLKEVTVEKTSSNVLGTGVIITYSENPHLAKASRYLDAANKAMDENNSSAVLKNAQLAVNSLKQYVGAVNLPSDPKQALNAAYSAKADAVKAFEQDFSSFLKKELDVSEFRAIEFTTISPVLGSEFLDNAKYTLTVAFILMIITVFLFFRTFVPSFAIILAAVFDMLSALAFMSLFGIPLTLPAISALLMLIGYSVDTDVMLTSRVLRRRGKTAAERVWDSMKTGLTMTTTTLAAVTVLFIIAYLTQMTVVLQIAFVILTGLFGDIFSTWFMNAPIILWYAKRKGVQ